MTDDRVRRPSSRTLKESRQTVLLASVASGAVSFIPIPLASMISLDLLRGVLVRRLGRRRRVEVSPTVALLVAGGNPLSPAPGEATRSTRWALSTRLGLRAGLSLARRFAWRRLGRSLLVLLRLDEVGHTFLLGTLFDYYCLAHHSGHSLHHRQAEAVHRVIDEVTRQAPAAMTAAAIQRSIQDLVETAMAMPASLRTLLLSGKLPDGQESATPITGADEEMTDTGAAEPEEAVELELTDVLARVARWIGREVIAVGEAAWESLYRRFDEQWIEENGPRADDMRRKNGTAEPLDEE